MSDNHKMISIRINMWIRIFNINIKKSKRKGQGGTRKEEHEITIQEKTREIGKVNNEKKRVEDYHDLDVNEIKSLNAQIDSYKKKFDELGKQKDKIDHQKKQKEREIEWEFSLIITKVMWKQRLRNLIRKTLTRCTRWMQNLRELEIKKSKTNKKFKNKIDHMIEDVYLD